MTLHDGGRDLDSGRDAYCAASTWSKGGTAVVSNIHPDVDVAQGSQTREVGLIERFTQPPVRGMPRPVSKGGRDLFSVDCVGHPDHGMPGGQSELRDNISWCVLDAIPAETRANLHLRKV